MDIFLWDDDVLEAYMISKYNRSVAGAFAYVTMDFFFIPTGGTFGSNTSPYEYELLARARSFLAEYLSRDKPLVMKHAEILNLVKFDVEYDTYRVSHPQATLTTFHKGVHNPSKRHYGNTPHN